MTDGAKTSEFLVAIVGGIVAITNGLVSTNTNIVAVSTVCLTAIVCTFIWSRTKIKETAESKKGK